MASNHFSINPTGGTGSGEIIVTPTSTNNTQEDKVAVITIGNGNTTVPVTVTHYGMPSIALVGGQEPISAPATGATYQFYVKTHYQVQFRNKPDWITIDDGQGNYISSSTTINANVANGKTYNFTVQPNATNNARSTSNFGLWHYINGSLSNSFDEVSISQVQGAEDYITITPTSALDWDDTNAKSITINANVTYLVSHSNTTDFTLNGGNGYVTIRANNTNTGTTIKTDTISVVSTKAGFSYTATCVVTQYRQPRITLIGSATNIPWSGGDEYVTVVSDYYWWLSPTVAPDTNAYYEYISMQGKTADMNMAPTTGTTYTLSWNSNTGVTARSGQIYVGYLKLDNSTTGRSSSNFSFSQDYQASSTFEVTPTRIPSSTSEQVSSGGGTYYLTVTTDRPWSVTRTMNYCTVSPTAGTGNATVEVIVPASTKDGYSYSQVDGLAFGTTDAGIGASQTVYVYQYDRFTETPYVVVDPDDFDISSATSSYTYTVSANTDWRAYAVDGDGYPADWIDMPVTAGTSGYTTGLHFDVAVNLTDSARTATIQFLTGAGISIAAEVNISQAEGYVPVIDTITTNYNRIPSSSEASSAGTIMPYTMRVTASTDWYVSSKPSWITMPTTAGTSGITSSVPVGFNANTGSSRSGDIVLVAGNASKTVTCYQQAAYTHSYDDLYVEPEDGTSELMNIPATGGVYSFIFENDGADSVDWEINFSNEEWGGFYDGSDPSQSDAVYQIEAGTIGYIWLYVDGTDSGRDNTITFYPSQGAGTLTQKTFTLHQNG